MKKRMIMLFLFLGIAILMFIGENNSIQIMSSIDINNDRLTLREGNPFNDANLYKCVVDSYNKLTDVEKKTEQDDLNDSELNKITQLTCGSKDSPITDLTGIDKLTNLKNLILSNMTIDITNINKLKKLEYLSFQYITFSNKDVVLDLPQLIVIEVMNSDAKSLDLSNLTKLTTERIKNNSDLVSIKFVGGTDGKYAGKDADYKNYARLQYPDITNNPQLTSLDFSGISNLPRLEVYNNKKLTSVNLNGCTGLLYINLNDNNLDKIDVSDSTSLINLSVANNNLTNIDLKNNTNLTSLNLSNNKISEFNINHSENKLLQKLYIDNNQLTSIDLSNFKKLIALKLDGNNFVSSKAITVYKDTPFDISNILTSEISEKQSETNEKYVEISDSIKMPFLKNVKQEDIKVTYSSINGDKNVVIKNNTITVSKTGTYSFNAIYNHNLYISDMGTLATSTKFKIKYDNLKVVELTTKSDNTGYIINNEKGYIYTAFDIDKDTIESKLELTSDSNATFEVNSDANTLTVKDENGNAIKVFKLVHINIEEANENYKETLRDGYIFLGNNNYDGGITASNATLSYDNNNNVIKIELDDTNDLITTIAVIVVNSDSYKFGNTGNTGYIYTKDKEFKENSISIKGLTGAVKNYDSNANTLTITYKGKVVVTYKIVTYNVTNTNYKAASVYIFTKYHTFDKEKDITVTNVDTNDLVVNDEDNTLEIKYNDISLDKIKIITYSSDTYKFGDGYVYIGKDSTFDKTKIDITNANNNDITYNNTGYSRNIVIYYNDNSNKIALETLDVVSYKSSKYDFSQKYYDLGTNSYSRSDITVYPVVSKASVIYEEDTLKIMYGNSVIDSLDIITYNSTVYDLNKDYIYLGTENYHEGNITKSSNVTIDTTDTELEIKYNQEVVKKYKLFKLTIDEDLEHTAHIISLKNQKYEYQDFITKINPSNNELKVSVYDKDGKLVTSGDITRNMQVKIEYNNNVLHTYTILNEIDEEYVDFHDLDLSSNEEDGKKYILNLGTNITVDALKEKIDTTGDITVVDRKGKGTNIIGTGCVLKIKFKDGESIEYTLIVRGDTTGDGKIDLNDVTKDFQYYRKKIKMEDYFIKAGKVIDKNKNITLNDVTKLFQYYRGKIDSLEG